VADNGSADGSASTLAREFPEAQVLALGQNLGFAAATNRATQLARAPWLVMFNSDAEVQPDTMAQVEDLLARHPDVDVLGGQLLNSDGSLQRSTMPRGSPKRFEHRNQHVELVKVDGIVGAFMVIRHALWRQLGGMDEGFFLYCEETDFCWRARKAGRAVHWSPRVRVRHHRGSSAGQVNLRSKVEFCRSLDRFNRKHRSPWRYRAFQATTLASLIFNSVGNLALCGLTLGLHRRSRGRLRWYSHLLNWKLRGSPPGWGLDRR
jgi:N-acetylglucosaminyl-diphospho-decaprenol L-rhamnosyltransferase